MGTAPVGATWEEASPVTPLLIFQEEAGNPFLKAALSGFLSVETGCKPSYAAGGTVNWCRCFGDGLADRQGPNRVITGPTNSTPR